MVKVFISYRRNDSAGHAGRVHDRLEREFGRDLLFMDVDTVPLGANFVKVLDEEVSKCDVLLAIIGPDWLAARDDEGNRRLESPHDFVRIEIAAALKRSIPVIPILLDGTPIPRPDQLPEELKELSLRNGLDIRHASFHSDVDKLIRRLQPPNLAQIASLSSGADSPRTFFDTLNVIEGPFSEPPMWVGGAKFFERTKDGFKELKGPHLEGSFFNKMRSIRGIFLGIPQQYWKVNTALHLHPPVKLEMPSLHAGLWFEITAEFTLQVIDALEVLNQNVRSLKDVFTPIIRRELAPIVRRFSISQSRELLAELERHFGDQFGTSAVKGKNIVFWVRPKDQAHAAQAISSLQLQAVRLEADLARAKTEEFNAKTGNMSIHDMALAAIATSNPRLIDGYKNILDEGGEAHRRNWETLKFLIENKLIEPHDLEKHLGKLPRELLDSLTPSRSAETKLPLAAPDGWGTGP